MPPKHSPNSHTLRCAYGLFLTVQIRLPVLKFSIMSWLIIVAMILVSCSTNEQESENLASGLLVADVLAVQVTGRSNAYEFSVELRSPDKDCGQYADWWEVLSEDGTLLYRRILTHSHVTEQPFVRSGGPILIESSDVVLVRGHMRPAGYGGKVLSGSVQNGFREVMIGSEFADDVEDKPPQPDDCRF